MKVPLNVPGDLFTAVCLRGADTLINDATEPRISARLPRWYVEGVNAPSFLLLPLQMKGQPFALIYADQAVPGGIVVDDKALGLLRTSRNQAVMAFRQAGWLPGAAVSPIIGGWPPFLKKPLSCNAYCPCFGGLTCPCCLSCCC